MDEEKLNEKGVFTTVGRVAGQYLGDKIGVIGRRSGGKHLVFKQIIIHKNKNSKGRFKKFRRVFKKRLQASDLTK